MKASCTISGRFLSYRGLSSLSRSKYFSTLTTSKWKRVSNEPVKTRVPEYFEGRLEPNIAHHDCYILLHSSQSPATFPMVFNTPLSLELQRRASKWSGLVNFSWFDEQSVPPPAPNTQPATVFSHLGGRLEIPDISLENLDRVEETIQSHLRGPLADLTAENVHVYVCTHGARDCRCGERGGRVLESLQEAVRTERNRHPDGPANRIKVGAVGHVGGHKFAANLLLFPQGERLGIVKPEDSAMIINRLCEELNRGVKPFSSTEEPLFLSHWRGRMGLTKEEQKAIWNKAYGLQDESTPPERMLKPTQRR